MTSEDMGQEASQPFDIHNSRTTAPTAASVSPATMETSRAIVSAQAMGHPHDNVDMEDALPDVPLEADVSSSPDFEALTTSEEVQLSSDTSEESPSHNWWLRPSRCVGPCKGAWYDQDETGDFDPIQEAKRQRSRKKAKPSVRGTRQEKAQDGMNSSEVEVGLDSPPSLDVCLSFTEPAAKDAFSQLCERYDSRVKAACDHFAEGYQLRERKSATADLTEDLSNHPAARGCHACLSMEFSCSLKENEQSWPCDDCEAAGVDCLLVKEPKLKSACTSCQHLGKKQKWLVCSFDYEQDPTKHQGFCKKCLEDGNQSCIAGPRPGEIYSRVRYRWDGEKYTPYRNQPDPKTKDPGITTCRRCLDDQRVCSFASGSSWDTPLTCTACDMSGAVCEPPGTQKALQNRPQSRSQVSLDDYSYDMDVDEEELASLLNNLDALPILPELMLSNDHHPTDDQRRHAVKLSPGPSKPYGRAGKFDRTGAADDAISISSGSSVSDKGNTAERPITISPEPPANRDGIVKIVRTKFCHPIIFGDPHTPPTRAEPCHFCASAQFSILGLEERVVEVIERPDSSGWDEVRGGHRDDGVHSTQVCTSCTKVRVDIALCHSHDLKPIPRHVNRNVDLETALETLFAGTPRVRERWCGICCNLAVWECHTKQMVEAGGGDGCGLALCEHCAADLDGKIFDDMLKNLVDENTERRPLGLRADHVLLKRGGLLRKYVG